jgi:uncharacterized membrane protein YhaH (DUF805 family)
MAPDLFFSYRGRLRRSTFWLVSLFLIVAFGAVFAALEAGVGRSSTLVLYPPFFWSAGALLVRRWHDRGRSAAWLLVLLLPILGPLWTGLQLGLLRGTRGENRYGPDPRRRAGEYARVA